MSPQATDTAITELLMAWGRGDQDAHEQLAGSVLAELRKLARSYLRRERPDHTLQPTALVNEAYLRLIDQDRVRWQNRAHFYGIAAQCMRRVLLDYGRRRKAAKREAGRLVPFEDALAKPDAGLGTLSRLAGAVDDLARLDARQAKVVELRIFGGFSIEDTAKALGISPGTVKRDWLTARLWLKREMARDGRRDA